MSRRSSFPLAASRLIVTAGLVLCILGAAILLLVGVALAIGWPHVMADAVEKGMEVKLAGVQPWVSLVILGAAAILAGTAQMLKDLLSVLRAVSAGVPFAAANGMRLRRIGWVMLGLQGLGLLTGLAVSMIPWGDERLGGFEPSFNGLLAALLAFVLADVFETARRMREELEGTI